MSTPGRGHGDEPGSRWRAVLDRLACTRGRRVVVRELPGGLSNHSLRVTAVEGAPLDVVVRVPVAGSPVAGSLGAGSLGAGSLGAGAAGVDREVEHRSTLRAATAGVGPRVVEFLPPDGPLVVEHLDARPLSPEEVRADLARVAALCRRLHAGPRFDTEVDMVAVQRRYLDLVARLGSWQPPGHADLEPTVTRVLAALSAGPADGTVATVPCHNDLPGGNVLDDGRRLWLVDFEFAGDNDPWCELGNLASGAALSGPQVEELVAAYAGDGGPGDNGGPGGPGAVARTRLWSAVCSWTWVLWASLQDATGGLEHDYRTLGAELHERAREELLSARIDRLLAQATGTGPRPPGPKGANLSDHRRVGG